MSQLKVASIFSNNMVLQRRKNIKIWGMGNNGKVVTVTLDNCTVSAKVYNGEWMAILPEHEAGGPYTLEVNDGNNTISFSNVMIGEVWFAGGQSNMELELQNSKNGKEVVANANDRNIRFYNTLRQSYIDEEFLDKETKNSWQECTPETCGTWSAVGYYYAKKLAAELNVTIGIVGCNWGGTSASAWMSRETLELDRDTNTYVEEYNKANEGRSFEEYLKQLEEYNLWFATWQKKVDKCYADDPEISWGKVLEIAGECRWPEPLGPKSPFRAGGLYETMVKRITPFSIKGFIYYQGESDDHKPTIYGKLLTKLIEQWRKDWEDDELPFIFVQLPMFINKDEEDKKNWAVIREQQMKVFKTIKNTGIAVALDCGEYGNIHPLDKEPVGNRLALQALYNVYKKEVMAYGPIYKSMKYVQNAIELSFDHAEDGIVLKGEEVQGFEIAGNDKLYVKAEVTIQKDKILVWSDSIKEPKYVRYEWTNYGPVTLFNKTGLPMAPFRTSFYDEK